mmetsp:Transcript_15878/g.47783  ORF Transcript_15878/g.47783 Transcript_15878/m.47783 type:complete len:233 (-) Transcript_15878:685-1383(-)
MSERSGSPCTRTSSPIFSCTSMAYAMYSFTRFSYAVWSMVPSRSSLRALRMSLVWGKEPMVVVGKAGTSICLGRRVSKSSLRSNSFSSNSSWSSVGALGAGRRSSWSGVRPATARAAATISSSFWVAKERRSSSWGASPFSMRLSTGRCCSDTLDCTLMFVMPCLTREPRRAVGTSPSAHTERPSTIPAPSRLSWGKPCLAMRSAVAHPRADPGTPRKSKEIAWTGSLMAHS